MEKQNLARYVEFTTRNAYELNMNGGHHLDKCRCGKVKPIVYPSCWDCYQKNKKK